MNYRHAYHAGNFADCFKHALLVALVKSFARKASPFFVLDTHAGAGRYDLEAEAARRTGESESGIRRLMLGKSAVLERYLGLVETLGLYPGSPTIIRALLRPSDRLACCETHPDDSSLLQRQFHRDPQVEVHQRSGWEALGALLPPNEKRGLVFVDPPFEDSNEFAIMANGLRRAHGRFGNGVLAAWYPIKQRAAVRTFHAEMAEIPDVVAVELYLREPTTADRLNGCGLVVVNPPYQFEEQSISISAAVLDGISRGESGAGTAVIRIANE
jgi:23S rRNA (adenine2030-N6)-methyltransferase